jgi:hypothetical protein
MDQATNESKRGAGGDTRTPQAKQEIARREQQILRSDRPSRYSSSLLYKVLTLTPRVAAARVLLPASEFDGSQNHLLFDGFERRAERHLDIAGSTGVGDSKRTQPEIVHAGAGYSGDSSSESPEIRTRWRSEMNSNLQAT